MMQEINKKSIYGFLILVILFSTAFSVKLIFSHFNSLDNKISPNFPLTSDNEITLITPENKTYTQPMTGYFPGTFDFENEIDGTSRTSIAYVDGTNAIQSNCEVEITNNYQGHNKVLHIRDGNTAGNAEANNHFDSTQTTGTIEWWWLTPVADSRMWIHFHEGTFGTIAFNLYTNLGEFVQNNGTAVQAYTLNQWVHHKVSFDTASDTYDWYINDAQVVDGGAFANPVSNIGGTNLKGAWSTTGESYYDAFGYSWDSNYNIGDNMNEGLLLSYGSSVILDTVKYSLDGLSNKTIIGDTSINYPNEGFHFIQVFGNDSLGDWYESEVRYFNISAIISPSISIFTPENKTYTQPMTGYFPATYGFENELAGTSRTSIAYVDGTNAIQSNCEVEITNNYQGHNKVLHVRDGNTAGNAEAHHYFDSTQTTGTTEWWWLVPAAGDSRMWVHFQQDHIGTIALSISAVNSLFYQTDGIAVQTYNFNQWYHHRVTFDTISDTYDWYIDDIMVVNGEAFENPVSNVGSINLKGAWVSTGESYFDAFGYSWNSGYNIGDNLNEGLLLSYTTTISFDWIGYSLDGNLNITITGDTVIPVPEFGVHSIILNGITSIGASIRSDLRHFTVLIDIQDPPIPPDNPDLIPIILTSIGIGIVGLLSITLLLYRRKIFNRTSSTRILLKKSQSDEDKTSGSDHFKTCPLCHTQIKKTDQFCEYCGVSLKND